MTKEDEAYEELDDLIDRIGTATQVGVLLVIIDRLKTLDADYVSAAVTANKDIAKMEDVFAKGRKAMAKAVDEAYSKMDDINKEWSEPYYSASKTEYSDKADNVIAKGKKAAKKEIEALCNTRVTGLIDDKGKIKRYIPLKKAYTKTINEAVTAMKSGERTLQQVVSESAKSLSRNGLRVRYESGATRELYGAVRMNVIDTYSKTMMEQRLAHGEAFGADGWEVSAHSPCAPDHLPYQGLRFSKKEYEELQEGELRDRPIETGFNCRHTVSPVIMDIGESAYSAEQLQDMARDSEEDVSFDGLSGDELTMSRYDATQYQRNLERNIRAAKTDALFDSENKDAHEARAAKLTSAYKDMSRKTGLGTRMERTELYALR